MANMNWFDIGVNLTDERLPLQETVEQALAAGVSRLAITGTDLDGSKQAAAMVDQNPLHLVSTAGVHPHYASAADAGVIRQLAELARHPGVVAIGECGLDFNRNFSAPEDQLRVFEQQLQLACDLGKPVFLHERDAFDAQLVLLQRYASDLVGGVAHCFTGNTEQMQAYLDLGLYIGVTGWVCDERRGQNLQQAVKSLPLQRLLLETDAPYLFPKSLRPRQRNNVPANLPHIGGFVAELVEVGVSDVAKASYSNANTLFGLSDDGR